MLLLALIVLVGVELYNWFNVSANGQTINMAYSDFLTYVKQGDVKQVTIYDNGNINGQLTRTITYTQQDGTAVTSSKFQTFEHLSNDQPLYAALESANVKVYNVSSGTSDFLWTILLNVGPIILLVLLLLWFSRRATQSQQNIFNFGRSRAKLIMEDRPSTTFADVAGVDEAKSELEEVVEFLKTPQKFQRLGGKIPKGVLLVGPPGTGKTLLARAVAGEAGVPFFSMSGSEFVEVLVGVGASRVRDLFDQAKKAAPSIIFIDEIDAVGRQRGTSLTTNDEREQTLNQLLVEMDGFDTRQAVVVVAATNRPDNLDQALLRPGRFDRRVTVDRPDWKGRQAILKIHARGVPLASDVDFVTAGAHDDRHGRRRSGQSGQRGRAARGAPQPGPRQHALLLRRAGPHPAWRRASAGAHRGRPADCGDPRGWPCAGRPADAALRSGDEGDDCAARPGAGRHAVHAAGRSLQLLQGVSVRAHHDSARWARRRGCGRSAASRPARRTTSSR